MERQEGFPLQYRAVAVASAMLVGAGMLAGCGSGKESDRPVTGSDVTLTAPEPLGEEGGPDDIPQDCLYPDPSVVKSKKVITCIGESEWVEVDKASTSQRANSGNVQVAGEDCLIMMGSMLQTTRAKINGQRVVRYINPYAFGNECADNTRINMTPKEVKRQHRLFLSLVS